MKTPKSQPLKKTDNNDQRPSKKPKLTRPNPDAMFMIVYDKSTKKRHFFSAPHDGGPLTCLLTYKITNAMTEPTEAQHVNGLILYTSSEGYAADVYTLVLNPSTRHVYKLNLPDKMRMYHFFGYDESNDVHKILHIGFTISGSTSPISFMVFSLSDYLWKKIDLEIFRPFCINWAEWFEAKITSVCINSVIHFMLAKQNVIYAFDLKTEKLLIINIPKKMYGRNYLINLNGFLGVYRIDVFVLELWMLKDYDNRVWVKRTNPLTKTRSEFRYSLIHSVNTNQILFSPLALKKDVTSMPIYDMKTKSFRSVELTLGREFLNAKTLYVHHAGSYVESNVPLKGRVVGGRYIQLVQ